MQEYQLEFLCLGEHNMKITIDSAEALTRAADYYHDTKFYIRSANYDSEKKRFSVRLDRIEWDEKTMLLNLLLIQVFSAPRTESVLCFEEVSDFELELIEEHFSDSEPVDFISTIEYHSLERTIEFKCIYGSVIRLFVSRLNGKLEDIRRTIRKAHFAYFLGIEIGGQ